MFQFFASRSRIVSASFFIALVCFAFVQVFVRIAERDFFNDEYYHIETAQGFLETGEFVQWDFTHNVPRLNEDGSVMRYDRAWLYTVQVAVAARLFGLSEFSARLPSAIWYVLLIVSIAIISARLSRSSSIGLVVAFSVAMMSQLLFYGQFVRMYIMVIVLVLWSAYSAYVVLNELARERVSRATVMVWVAVCVTSLTLSSLVHVQSLLLVPAYGIAFCVEWCIIEYRAYLQREHISVRRRFRYMASMLCIVAVILVCVVFSTDNVLSDRLLRIREKLNTPYLFHAFNGFAVPYAVMMLWLLGVLVYRKERSVRFFAIMSALPIVVLMIWVRRYDAERYIIFVVPLIICTLVSAYHMVWKLRWKGIVFGSLCVLVCVPWHMWWMDARSQETWQEFGYMYAHVREIVEDKDVIYSVDFRSYYWQDDEDRHIVDLGRYKSTSLEEFIQMLHDAGSGYIIIPSSKKQHIHKDIRSYCDAHFEQIIIHNAVIYHVF